MDFGAWEEVDLSFENVNVVAMRRFISWRPRPFWRKFTHSDPRLPMLQIPKERFLRVQLTELYKMTPEPKKGAH